MEDPVCVVHHDFAAGAAEQGRVREPLVGCERGMSCPVVVNVVQMVVVGHVGCIGLWADAERTANALVHWRRHCGRSCEKKKIKSQQTSLP